MQQNTRLTWAGILAERANRFPERRAYLFLDDGEREGAALTDRELDRKARAIAARLQERGLAGERALLLYPPGLEFVAAFLGCLLAGVVAVPAYPPRSKRHLPRLLAIADDARPAAVLTTATLRDSSALAGLLGTEPSGITGPFGLGTCVATDEVPAELADEWIPTVTVGDTGDDLAFLQYTSGSTAAPKGVRVRHANLLHNEEMIRRAFGQSADSVIVGWLPLYHDMGLIGNVLQPLYAGATCVLMSPLAFLQQPRRWLAAITRYRATTSGGPNFAYDLCARKVTGEALAGLDLSSWQVAFSGAEPVRGDTLARFAGAFAPAGFDARAFFPCYGLAEATLLVSGGAVGAGAVTVELDGRSLEEGKAVAPAPTAPPTPDAPEAAGVRELVACGRAWGGQRIAIVDPETAEEQGEGQVGEIWVAGPSVAGGYWNRPEATARDFGAFLAGAPAGEAAGPFLRTGDLGFLHGGELFVTGRLKDLIILRGRNLYPQDVELAAERSHPALRPGGGAAFAVEAEGEERLVLVQELARGRSPDAAVEIAAAVRRAVAEELEAQLWDLVLIRESTLPKTSSGKVQRQACRRLYLDGGLAVVGRSALGGGLEGGEDAGRLPFLLSLAARALRLPPAAIDPAAPLLAGGLDSLSAVELCHAIEAATGVRVEMTRLLAGASLLDVAADLGVDGGGATSLAPPIVPVPWAARDEALPLSFVQQGLWFLDQLEPGDPAYNISAAVRLAGPLDAAALERSIGAVVERHEALRTTFPGDPHAPGRPTAVIRSGAGEPAFHLLVESVENAQPAEDARLLEIARDDARRPFDLARGPLLRARLLRLGPEDAVILLAVHHIVADGWSLGVLVREVGEHYRAFVAGARPDLPALPVQYADFAAWQRRWLSGAALEAEVAYWREALAGAPTVLELPADRTRPAVRQPHGRTFRFVLPRDLADRLRAVARDQGATLFMTLLAAFTALLGVFTGRRDLLVGSPVANRGRSELEGLIGFFVNTLVLRADLAGDPDFSQLLARTRETALGAYAHQDVPFDQVVEALEVKRDLSHTPLFQVAFALQNAMPRLDLPGVAATPLAIDTGTVKFDWDLLFEETTAGLAGRLAYAATLFDAVTVQRAMGHLETLLRGVAQQPLQTLSRLPLLTAAELQQLTEWNDPSVPYEPGGFLHELIAAQAARMPDAVAVVFDGRRLTYGALDAQAGQVAAALRAIGGGTVGPESIVGVLMERSLEMVVGLLAVWKAGAAYLPLDPEDPAERLDHMLRDTGAAALVTAERFAAALPAAARELPLLVLGPQPLAPPPAKPAPALLPDHPAYVIYTSGSTGAPKGVMVPHRALANRACYASVTDRAEAFLQKTTIGFDVSVLEIFGPLQTGGRTVLAVPGGQRDSAYLVRLIAEEQISHAAFPPTLLDVLLAEGALDDCRALRTVVTGGEAVPPSLPERFFARIADRPDIELFNRYGPTETTVSITAWRCRTQPAGRTLPIGRPIASAEVHLLSADFRPVPIGVAGEICLGGLCLARGYLGRPELTAEKWIPHPSAADPGARLYRSGDLARFRTDGAIEFLGRVDHQVKIRGFRIELGEIAAVLATHEAVAEAVVVVREDGGAGGSRQLVAYHVQRTDGGASPGTPPEESELRSFLKRRLPDYMLPARFVALPALPTGRTGKVDLAALPPPGPRAGGAFDADGGEPGERPRSATEATLAAIWSQLLGVERVGLDDNFFSLGGDSILSLQVVARALQAGLRISARDVFQHQTIAELARVATAAMESSEVLAEVLPELLESAAGPVPLTPIQRWFFDLDPAEPHHWNQAVLLEVRRPLPADRLALALTALVAHHDALRLRFTRDAQTGDWWQTAVALADSGPPALLSALDLSALPSEEAETVLVASAAALQGSLDIFTGPLLRAALFDLGPGRPGRFLIVAHHLAVDGVSWRILLDDLETACDQAERGLAPVLPVRTTPFTRWVERLSDLALGPAGAGRAAELDLWSNEERAQAFPLPLDFTSPGGRQEAAAANTAGASGTVHVALDAETTAALLTDLPAIAQAGVDAALLATLAEACCNWSGAPSLLVNVEGHGREAVVPGADLSRTVGWFTTLFPVLLPAPDTPDRINSVRSVRSVQRRLEALPDRGIGYGLLRFGGGHPGAAAHLAALPQPEIAFNYLGRLDRVLAPASRFAPAVEPTGPALGPGNRRPHLLQIDAAVRGDHLEVSWIFGERLHLRATVERLAADHLAALRRLAEQCRTAPARNADEAGAAGTEYSPLDFPDVDLDQVQLDLILRQIGGQSSEGKW